MLSSRALFLTSSPTIMIEVSQYHTKVCSTFETCLLEELTEVAAHCGGSQAISSKLSDGHGGW